MEETIRTEGLSKRYGTTNAVSAVSLNVQRGEIYGFLGLNGAGKTTTIRMLLGMIRPSGGASFLNGTKIDSGSRDIWNRVGYLVEIPYSYPDLTVRENLNMLRRLRGIGDPAAVDTVIEKLKLGPYRDKPVKHLSLGNAQRLGLAKALIHEPDILILDEPANGLDPAGIVEIREMLLELVRSRGATVFISSHILGEISKFATRIGIIHKGRLLLELDAKRLRETRKRRLLLGAGNAKKALTLLREKGHSAGFKESGIIEIPGKDAADSAEDINSHLVRAGCPPYMLYVEEEDLESYFLRIVSERRGTE